MRFSFSKQNTDNSGNGEKEEKLLNWQKGSYVFFFFNSTAFYQVIRITAEHYFNNDRLSLGFHFLIMILTSGLALTIEYLTAGLPRKFRVWLSVGFTILMLLSAVLLPRFLDTYLGR